MRILVWGINYAPEVTGIGPHNTALCEFLKASGHEVEMVTTFCYYPAWRKRPEDSGHLYRTDQINGIPVHRCWHYVPVRTASWKRILHELSFIITSTLRALTLRKPDLIIVISPPLLIGAAAWLVGRVKCAPYLFHVQDLQPDGAMGLGMLKKSLFTRLLYGLEAFAYKKAWRVSGISKGILEAFSKKQTRESKLIYFPNTIVLPHDGQNHGRGIFRGKHGFREDDFLAVHSGNVGIKHGLDILVEAACHIKNERIKILICGEGTARDMLEDLAARHQLENVIFFPLQSGPDYIELLEDMDISLITQQKGSGHAFFPSKLLNALAYAKPVLAVAESDSELSRALAEGGFGVNVSHDAPEALARELDRLSGAKETLALYGKAGREFVQQFDRERVFREFDAAISRIGEWSK
ncbi:MAG: WcaI family glycosyltransferase [Chthoniobacteraceae bacterium]